MATPLKQISPTHQEFNLNGAAFRRDLVAVNNIHTVSLTQPHILKPKPFSLGNMDYRIGIQKNRKMIWTGWFQTPHFRLMKKMAPIIRRKNSIEPLLNPLYSAPKSFPSKLITLHTQINQTSSGYGIPKTLKLLVWMITPAMFFISCQNIIKIPYANLKKRRRSSKYPQQVPRFTPSTRFWEAIIPR